jgi:hypothetical protein
VWLRGCYEEYGLIETMTTPAKIRLSWLSNAILIRCLLDGPHTLYELVEETGLALDTVRGYVRALRNQKLVVIVGYLPARNGALVTVQYQWKPNAKDAPKPEAVSPRERAGRYRQRVASKSRDRLLHFANTNASLES